MTSVHFELYRVVDNDVAELDETALVDTVLDAGEELQGAIVIDGDDQPRVAIVDDLRSAVQRLCFEAVTVLLQPGASYGYLYFTSSEHAQLDANDETITVRGGDVPDAVYPRTELLRALYGCGQRYLDWVTKLGDRADDLTQIGPHATQARDALRQAGLL